MDRPKLWSRFSLLERRDFSKQWDTRDRCIDILMRGILEEEEGNIELEMTLRELCYLSLCLMGVNLL